MTMTHEDIVLVRSQESTRIDHNSFPKLLHTPSGLAVLEIQGTFNLSPQNEEEETNSKDPEAECRPPEILIGRLVFPDYDESDVKNNAWMKKVYMYVGNYQRLTGEVKKLPRALAIIRRKKSTEENMDGSTIKLEVVEIVKYKLLFSTRPEPIGN